MRPKEIAPNPPKPVDPNLRLSHVSPRFFFAKQSNVSSPWGALPATAGKLEIADDPFEVVMASAEPKP
jgi:hypothetical protein